MAVRENQLHIQGLKGLPQEILQFLLLMKILTYSSHSSAKWGLFDLENGLASPWGPIGCIVNVIKTSMQKFFIF